jgi:hypothetical protein
MSEDEVRLYLFLILYFAYILYLNYIQNLTLVTKDWQNMKCNPLYLLMDSFVSNPEESQAKFNNCIISAQEKKINIVSESSTV